jgi:fucose 4-O-acetylase-like acetyltransferase
MQFQLSQQMNATGTGVKRLSWLDCAKGIGIFLVVIGHVILGLRVDIVGPKLHYYEVAAKLIYTFHMPLFFFISGLLFGRRRPESLISFLHSMTIGIVAPYVIWSVLFVVLQNAFPSNVNHLFEIRQIFGIVTTPIGHMWFLYALIIVQIVYFSAMRLWGTTGMIIAGLVFTALCFRTFSGAPMGGTFFGFGLIAAALRPIEMPSWHCMAIFGIAGLVWVIAASALLNGYDLLSLMPIATALAGIIMVIALSQILARSGIVTILAQLGQASIAIFVAHTIFSAGARGVISGLGIMDCDFHVITETLIGLVVPTMLFLAANLAGLAPYVGFGRNQSLLYVFPLRRSLEPLP